MRLRSEENRLLQRFLYVLGMKGVVYADAFQCVIVIAGRLVAVGFGLAKLDSVTDAWDLSWDWERIQVTDVNSYEGQPPQ